MAVVSIDTQSTNSRSIVCFDAVNRMLAEMDEASRSVELRCNGPSLIVKTSFVLETCAPHDSCVTNDDRDVVASKPTARDAGIDLL